MAPCRVQAGGAPLRLYGHPSSIANAILAPGYRACDDASRGAAMPEPSIIGRNVARLRREKDLTQTALARLSGVSQNFISDLEGGRRTQALVNAVAALAGALGVTVDDMLREPVSAKTESPGGAAP